MKRPYLVVTGDKFPRKDVLDRMGQNLSFGIWFYSMPNSFIIYSSLDADAISKFIRDITADKIRIFVTEITVSNNQGWMPGPHWDIINNGGTDKKYDLSFQGFFRDASELPKKPGVYCVHSGVYNEIAKTVTLRKLLYIGQSDCVGIHLANSSNLQVWSGKLSCGEELWFSFAQIDADELDRCASALVYDNQPECNSIGKDGFRYMDTIVSVGGAIGLLKPGRMIERDKL